MSLHLLPRELRLHIWALAYHREPPRLVAIETLPHICHHDETTFCPRYSPSPAPTVANLCQEARAEARFQATKAQHIVRLSSEAVTTQSEDFYFRCSTDILYLNLEGDHVKHYDDSPETGLLAHFREAIGCDPTLLRKIAVTKVIVHGFKDGSLSNVLRDFPNISSMVMMVTDDVWENELQKEIFVRAAARIVRMYKLDLMIRARDIGDTFKARPFDVEFARCKKGLLEVIPPDVWRGWSDGGDDWATLDATVDPFW